MKKGFWSRKLQLEAAHVLLFPAAALVLDLWETEWDDIHYTQVILQ